MRQGRQRLALLLLVGASGCVTQRSLVIGQMAAPVGKGGADLSVSTGFMYAGQTEPPYETSTASGDKINNQNAGKGLSIPWFEGNANYGFTDQIALNLHMSPAGIQPGLKWTLNRSLIAHIALLPEIGFGYGSTGSSTYTSTGGAQMEVNPTSQTRFILTAGLKVLISHKSGFFTAVGYDFYFTRGATNGTTGTGGTVQLTQTIVTSLEHTITAGVGFSVAISMISIRPELDFAIVPAINTSTQVGTLDSVGGSGGFGYAFHFGFAFALTTPPSTKNRGAEEDEKNVSGSEEEKEKEEEAPPPKKRSRDEDDN